MDITVIGHLCFDVIHHQDKSETESFGGIFYPVSTLANLMKPGDTVKPVFGVGRNEYETVIRQLERYPNVDTRGVFKFDGVTNRVHLFYEPSGTRVECSTDITEPIPLSRIRPHLKTDMALVNMVSGFDLTIDTLDEIRMATREDLTPVYLDCHSLSLGVQPDGTRIRRPLETWRRWLFMLHAVQMNEEEAGGLSPEPLSEEDFAKLALALMTQNLIITRGKTGYTLWQEDHKRIIKTEGTPQDHPDSPDPTGCGDVFGAAYCAHYVRSKDPRLAAEFANRIAGWKSTQRGSSTIDQIPKYLKEELYSREKSP